MDCELELPPASIIKQLIFTKLTQPVIFKGFIKEWELLNWNLETWAAKLGEKPLPFRCGTGKFTKVYINEYNSLKTIIKPLLIITNLILPFSLNSLKFSF